MKFTDYIDIKFAKKNGTDNSFNQEEEGSSFIRY